MDFINQKETYLHQTNNILTLIETGKINDIQIDELKAVIRFHEYYYYVLSSPLISDPTYDALFTALKQREAQNPHLVTADSPTQRLSNTRQANFENTAHIVPMLSLENSYNMQDILDWENRLLDYVFSHDALQYCVEPKYDGASISLVYENDLLVRAVTRGDGISGDDVTQNIKQIKSVPLSAAFSAFGIQQIEIRGEVVMTKQSFHEFNQTQQQKGLPLLANPRNAASGSLRMKDAAEVAKRKLDTFLYHISYVTYANNTVQKIISHYDAIKLLQHCGFKTPLHDMRLLNTVEEVNTYLQQFEQQRETLPYEIDGMVIKVNSFEQQELIGNTSHHPRWAIAYKFKAQQAETTILQIDYQVGRTGAVTPVAKLQPVSVGGVVVSSISIHNEDYIKQKDLHINDTVIIERAGDVIPQISHVVLEKRNKQHLIYITFPTHCPVCKAELYKEATEAVWRCINIECEAQVIERIIHFASKDAMDIRSLGEANIQRFYELGLLKDIPAIYLLDTNQIATLEGLGKKSADNLRAAIQQSKNQPLHRLIYGLGIRFVGETTAKTLANSIQHILDLSEKSVEDLKLLQDVGEKVATSIYNFFHQQQNIAMIQQLEQLGVNVMNNKKEALVGGELSNQSFLFTGTLTKLKRSEAEQLVEQMGGTILSGVSAKLNYLIVGADAGSKLEKAKKFASIQILTEEEFLSIIEKK